ncbi:hypothetical protein GCM10027199_82580 [Amycolatopsis magusensis]
MVEESAVAAIVRTVNPATPWPASIWMPAWRKRSLVSAADRALLFRAVMVPCFWGW